MLDTKFQLPALERLAKIVGEAYSGAEVADLFRKAGFGTIVHGGGTGRLFLYAALEKLQRDCGAGAILEVLKAACSAQGTPGRGDVREGVNECLSFYGLGIGEDGVLRSAENARTPPGGDRAAFLQRNYHRLVIESSEKKFLQGDYFGAVHDCSREFERFVSAKSGIGGSGEDLMARALGPGATRGAALEMSLPNASRETVEGVQEGIMHMCVGIVASARGPAAHEPGRGLPMGREDALDMLGVLSHLCRQIDRMRPRARG